MSRELEARLERTFADLPEAAPEVEDRARRAALAALPRRRRARRTAGVAAVALAGAGIGALTLVGLRATGTIHLQVGSRARADQPSPVVSRLLVPRGGDGIAAVVDGRLWLSTRRGVRIEGLPVSAAGLSPNALYVGVGLGRSLVAMAPTRRPAWTHVTGGPVVAVAWAPDGLRVAYVVHLGTRYALRLIEGDGDHDQLVDPSVRPVRPSWRADSLALAYVGAGGHPVVLDLGHDSRHVLGRECGPASQVAFAVAGSHVAAATDGGIVVDRRCLRRGLAAVGPLGWLGSADLVYARAGAASMLARIATGRPDVGAPRDACPAGPVDALATWAAPNGLAVAIRSGAGIQLRALARSSSWSGCPAVRGALLLDLPHARHVTSLDVR
jgi:hypothetical protein